MTCGPCSSAFLAWMVHLEFGGEMFSFLLDVIEVPEVHYEIISTHQLVLTLFFSLTQGLQWKKPFKRCSSPSAQPRRFLQLTQTTQQLTTSRRPNSAP